MNDHCYYWSKLLKETLWYSGKVSFMARPFYHYCKGLDITGMSKFEASMKQFCTKYGEFKILTLARKMTDLLSRIALFFRARLKGQKI